MTDHPTTTPSCNQAGSSASPEALWRSPTVADVVHFFGLAPPDPPNCPGRTWSISSVDHQAGIITIQEDT